MKILFVSGDLIAGNLAYKLKKECNEVRLFIGNKNDSDCFENMVDKTSDWKKEIGWVGKDGLIIFDDVGYGKEQDELRDSGYNVFGGCELGDKLELDREYAQKVFKNYGMDSEETKDFINFDDAINYIKKHNCAWVLKQNIHESYLTYVGIDNKGRDVIDLINSYKDYDGSALYKISLQKRVKGIEVAVGRFFNGNDWCSPVLVNFEHKPFLNDNLGPLTAEMGTVGKYQEEENKLFTETLEKLKPYLKKISYKGYADINCIVNKEKIVPLEATMRFGTPINYLQDNLHISYWGDFLLHGAKGEYFKLDYNKNFAIVLTVAIPPFPYKMEKFNSYSKNVRIFFKGELTEDEWKRIHFEEVSYNKVSNSYYVAGAEGYILYVTGTGKTMDEARNQAYGLVEKVSIPRMMYRTDIGIKVDEYLKSLREWKYL